MEATKTHAFMGFGAMEDAKPYDFIGFGAMEATKPYEFKPRGLLLEPVGSGRCSTAVGRCSMLRMLLGHLLNSKPFQRAIKYVFFKPVRTPADPKIGRKRGPRAPQISSNRRRKSLDFEIGVGHRLGTLRMSRSNRLF